MEVEDRIADVGMAEQPLNGAQVDTRFEQMSSKTMAQGVRMNIRRKSRPFCRMAAGEPDHLVIDWLVGSPALAGKQIHLRFLPAPVLAQGIEQRRAEGNIAVLAALALADVDHPALAVDIGHLEMTQLGPAHA